MQGTGEWGMGIGEGFGNRESGSAGRGSGIGSPWLLFGTIVALFSAASLGASGSAGGQPPSLKTPNPWLAWLPDGEEPDWGTWVPRVEARAHTLAAARAHRRGPLPEIAESEGPGETGANDAPFVAEPLPLGTLPGRDRALWATGWLRPTPTVLATSAEPDDAIPTARLLALPPGSLVSIPGQIGDGAHGSGGGAPSGDFDCVAISTAPDTRLEIAVVTPEPLADLDPILVAYDTTGAILALNDNLPISGFLSNLDAYVSLRAPASGELVACALGTSATPRPPGDTADHLLLDPFDGSTGPGVGSEGAYELWISAGVADPRDRDVWDFELREGDAIGIAANAAARRLILRDPTGEVRIRSGGADLSGLYPALSPLPGGLGGPAVSAVADVTGRWSVEVSGVSWFFTPGYRLELVAERPPLDEAPSPRRQRVLLDIDGATFDREIFGLPSSTVTLSPLPAFLPGWGLDAEQLDVLVDTLVEVVDRVLRAEIAALGGNGDGRTTEIPGFFDLEVLDSRSGDPFGEPDVLRVVIGGTIAELGATTIGLAEAIDPGNFDTAGTAVVLLDLLSGPASSASSLNRWREHLTPHDWLDFVAEGLGRIAAHEAGHLLAAFHTTRDVGPVQIMDRGGRLDFLVGVGADGVPGTADDVGVMFGADQLESAEGYAGLQDSLDAVSFGDPVAGLRAELAVGPLALDFSAVAVGDQLELELLVSAVGGLATLVTPSLSDASTGFMLPAPGAFLAPSGGAAVLPVRFAPTAAGEHLGALQLEAAGATRVIPLRGIGGLGSGELEPSVLDLGDIEYGPAGSELSETITLRNGGPAALFVDQLDLSGPDASLFELDAGGPLVLAAGAELEVEVTFAPGGLVGPRSARVVALVRDPATPRLETLLSARAHGADLLLSPPSPYFFGLPRPGQARIRTFKLENVGDRDLVLGVPSISGPDATLFEILAGPLPTLVPPGAIADLTVRFAPLELGDFAAELTLPTNDPDGDPLVIQLQGTGGGGIAGLVPAPPIDLGQVPIGGSLDLVVSLRNVGTLTLFVGALSLDGPAAGEIALLGSTGPFGLSPGSVIAVPLRFSPSIEGLREAELLVASDDPSAPVRGFELFGIGVGEGDPPGPGNPLEIPTTTGIGLLALGLLLVGAALRRLANSAPGL